MDLSQQSGPVDPLKHGVWASKTNLHWLFNHERRMAFFGYPFCRPAAGVGPRQADGRQRYTSTRSMPPLLARATYSGSQSSPSIRRAISTTM